MDNLEKISFAAVQELS